MKLSEIILVVEDNPDNRMLVEKILTHKGFETAMVEDGELALKWCEETIPRLILMDVSLPGIDGLKVTSLLREKEEFKDVPIIALTAHAMKGWEEKARQAGCTSYLSKPVMPKVLIDSLNKLLPAQTG